MNDRTFGVELEFNLGRISNQFSKAQEILAAEGIDWWTSRGNWIGSDGSGIEIRTPILSGQKGLNELKRAMNALVAAGGRCTSADGLHVHHGAPEFVDNKDLMTLAAESWHNVRPIIADFVNSRRNGSSACPNQWSKSRIERLKGAEAGSVNDWHNPQRYLRYACSGRGDFNLSALYEHGTIEFRLHEGTLDADAAEAWIRFGQRFLTSILKRQRPLVADDAGELLRKIKCPKTAQANLLGRVVAKEKAYKKDSKLLAAYMVA